MLSSLKLLEVVLMLLLIVAFGEYEGVGLVQIRSPILPLIIRSREEYRTSRVRILGLSII
jgi:hypothetical protein